MSVLEDDNLPLDWNTGGTLLPLLIISSALSLVLPLGCAYFPAPPLPPPHYSTKHLHLHTYILKHSPSSNCILGITHLAHGPSPLFLCFSFLLVACCYLLARPALVAASRRISRSCEILPPSSLFFLLSSAPGVCFMPVFLCSRDYGRYHVS